MSSLPTSALLRQLLKARLLYCGQREADLFFIRAFWPAFVVDALVIAMMVHAAS
jgi:hypothetical protein